MNKQILYELVARHAAVEGLTSTPIEGLQLLRISQPIERLPAITPASMCCLVQGSKRAYLGGVAHTYDPDHYLCASMPLPVEAEVPFATAAEPVLGVMLDLDTLMMAETLVSYEAVAHSGRSESTRELSPGLIIARMDNAFVEAVGRLLQLLDNPAALHVLASGRLREVLFAIIEGEAGPLVRRTFNGALEITRVLAYLRENLSEPVSVDDLARRAGMSRAVFHRRFKDATTFSPLQFIKTMRLSHAAMQLVSGETVNVAAEAVGYVSPSQFSREFRRQFGASPRQWAKTVAGSANGSTAVGG